MLLNATHGVILYAARQTHGNDKKKQYIQYISEHQTSHVCVSFLVVGHSWKTVETFSGKIHKESSITELLRMRCWHGSARIQKRTHPGDGPETRPKPARKLQMCLEIHIFFVGLPFNNPVIGGVQRFNVPHFELVLLKQTPGDISGLQIWNPNVRCPLNRKTEKIWWKHQEKTIKETENP